MTSLPQPTKKRLILKTKESNTTQNERMYPQLTFSEESYIKKLEKHPNKTTKQSNHLEYCQSIVAIPPISLELTGVSFVNQLIQPPTDGIHGLIHNDTSNHIYALLLPIKTMESSQTDFCRFRVSRDNERIFSTDGSALVFTDTDSSTKHSYGVLYPNCSLFYARESLRGTSYSKVRELLQNSIADIFMSISVNPEAYFSTMGQQCGICMICGRELTDEDSKARGLGPVCRRVFRR